MACGVGASLGSVMRNMTAMTKLARLATTGRMRCLPASSGGGAVARGSSPYRSGLHFYAFGGVSATARWIRAVIDGNFALKSDSDKFAMNS